MTRARELADLLTGGQTITTADNSAQLTLESTDADASVGPLLDMIRDSASPADSDTLGRLRFRGDNDAGEAFTYGTITSKITDASDGTEGGLLTFLVGRNGSVTSALDLNETETVFNEGGLDADFRVEGDSEANLLFIDAGNDRVGIGTSTVDSALHIEQNASGVNETSGSTLKIHNTNASGRSKISLHNSAETASGSIYYDTDSGMLALQGDTGAGVAFHTGGNTERVRIDTSGFLTLPAGGVVSPHVSSSTAGISLAPEGSIRATAVGTQVFEINRIGDGQIGRFREGGSEEGNISVSGTTVSYNGGHLSRYSQFTDGNRIDGLVKGTVMTNLDQMAKWHHEAKAATLYEDGDEIPEGKKVGDEKTPAVDAYDEDNEQLNCMAVSSVEGDVNVAGVFVNWDDDDEDFTADMNVAMTGDMVIRIAKDTTIARGDLLMSAGDGTAKPQGDDIVRSKTIAKVTSITKSHTYDDGSYLVPCVLMAC